MLVSAPLLAVELLRLQDPSDLLLGCSSLCCLRSLSVSEDFGSWFVLWVVPHLAWFLEWEISLWSMHRLLLIVPSERMRGSS